MPLHRTLQLLGLAAPALALAALPALAGSTLTLPATGTGAVLGSGLLITNNRDAVSGTEPFAIEGAGTGMGAGGVLGNTSNLHSVGVEGANSGTGFGGLFSLTGPTTTNSDSALAALASGGSKTAKGHYGSAAMFATQNIKNQSPGVSIQTNGINSYALKVINTGVNDGKVTYGPPANLDFGGIAGHFEINNPKPQFGQAAIYALHSGGQKSGAGRLGNAGMFLISNTNNFDSALVGKTVADTGTGVEGDDRSLDGGVAVFGDSNKGLSAVFRGGSGGGGTCSYDGSSGWNCPSDRNLKERLETVDLGRLLARLDAMPVFYYRMKNAANAARYVGPTAQDFRAAFGLGRGDTTINTANAQGVALAAAKGLHQQQRADETAIAADRARIAALEALVAEQRAAIASLQQTVADLARRSAANSARVAAR